MRGGMILLLLPMLLHRASPSMPANEDLLRRRRSVQRSLAELSRKGARGWSGGSQQQFATPGARNISWDQFSQCEVGAAKNGGLCPNFGGGFVRRGLSARHTPTLTLDAAHGGPLRRLVRAVEQSEHRLRVVFIGDSLQGQIRTALRCALARGEEEQRDSSNVMTSNAAGASARPRASTFPSNFSQSSEGLHSTTPFNVFDSRRHANRKRGAGTPAAAGPVPPLLSPADEARLAGPAWAQAGKGAVLLLFDPAAAHYNDKAGWTQATRQAFSLDVEAHVLWLSKFCGERPGSACLWRGAFAQHWPTKHGLFEFGAQHASCRKDGGRVWVRHPPDYTCTGGAPQAALSASVGKAKGRGAPAWDWRDAEVRQAFRKHERKLLEANVYFLGLTRLTMPLRDIHPSGCDCTHLCYSPGVFEPIWHAAAVALEHATGRL